MFPDLLRPLRDRSFTGDGLRFMLAGGANTLISVLLYQLALSVMQPGLAYATAWAGGVLFVAAVYPNRVFPGGRTDGYSRLVLMVSYAVGFFLGLTILKVFIDAFAHERLGIFISLIVTTTYNFLVSRLILRRGF